jgi:drug/metabolite transporter (DMT)-like permease
MTATARIQEATPAERSAPLSVYARLWLAVIAWGGSFVAARLLLARTSAGQTVLSPTVLAALRFGLASLVFLPPLARASLRRQLTPGDLLRLFVLGQLAYALYFWLQYTGVQQTNASIASILVVGLIPLATAALAAVLRQERLTPPALAALLLGFAGVALIVLQGGRSVSVGGGFVFGAACLLGNAVAFAVYSNLSKRWMRTIPPLVLTAGTMTSGALGLLALSLADPATNRWSAVAHLDAAQWVALLFLALACSVAAYFAYNSALTKLPASRAAVFVYFEPVVAVALGATLLGERLSAQAVAGTAVIAVSVALLQARGRWLPSAAQHKPEPSADSAQA